MAIGPEQLKGRYLTLLRESLLGSHYMENGLRIQQLIAAARAGAEIDERRLADPARNMPGAFRQLEQRLETGDIPSSSPTPASALAHADVGRLRLDRLESCVDTILEGGVDGDLVDCGSARPGPAIYIRGILEAHDAGDRQVWMADPFLGADALATDGTLRPSGDVNNTREAFHRYGLLPGVKFLQGEPSRTVAEKGPETIALLRIDGHDPAEVKALLEAVYARVSPGGFVVVDDYGRDDCQAAVDEFRSANGIDEALERIDASAAEWRKSPERETLSAEGGTEAAPGATKQLSVVVIAHNMRREAARTLHSLSRAYQRGVDELDYEVIVVENGSEPEQSLGAELVRSFGPEFRYLDLGEEAATSPGPAVNAGIAASSGEVVAVMIDGAHVLTPGVLRNGMLALSTYEPAVATVKQWYVGPGQQPEMVPRGYDQEIEDRLFDQVEWPADGYRLFEIGHFIGARDWFDGDWESNCIFIPRSLLEQVGAMDESFSMAGGGFVNLDLYERLSGSPGVTRVTLLGEGSFHQVHGGTTTNAPKPEERMPLIWGYGDHYAELRGMRFVLPHQQIHFVGSLPPAARRTRRRPMSAEAFKNAAAHPEDRRPSRPVPFPDDLKTTFTEAFFHSRAAETATWLGTNTHRPPTDLHVLQELISELRPDWIVETRTGAGGRALFLASICELLGAGQVLSVDANPLDERPVHERITYLTGDPASEATAEEVRERVGPEPNALVIVGGAAGRQAMSAFEHLSPLVPVGSYVVFEDTVIDGIPVWPAFGTGPMSAAARIEGMGEFVVDSSRERYGLTFSQGGFLKRVR